MTWNIFELIINAYIFIYIYNIANIYVELIDSGSRMRIITVLN